MSTETIFKCDNHVRPEYKYNDEDAESRTPIEDGWLSGVVLKDPLPYVQVRRIEGTETHSGVQHFCSFRCLAAWTEDQLQEAAEEAVERLMPDPKEVNAN